MGRDHQIPIANVEVSEDEVSAVIDVLESGYLVQGSVTEQFEEEFSRRVGAENAVAISSGTAALHIAYLVHIDPDDEVLVPSFSHISTASMVEFAGGTPVFCDIDPHTFTIDLDDARDKVAEKTSAIAPVHLFGNSCDVGAIQDFAETHDLSVIWDAAQAHGTKYKGRDVGSVNDATCYSFYPTKNMFTGEGGMITTNDDEVAEECRLLRAHGQTEKYLHPTLGFNYRITDIGSAIGIGQLDKLEQFIRDRQSNAKFLTQNLSGVDGVYTPEIPDFAEHSYHQYTILINPDIVGKSRDDFAEQLDDHGIGNAVHYPRGIHQQPAFEKRYGSETLTVVEDLSNRILSLPVYPNLTDDELERIVESVETVASGK